MAFHVTEGDHELLTTFVTERKHKCAKRFARNALRMAGSSAYNKKLLEEMSDAGAAISYGSRSHKHSAMATPKISIVCKVSGTAMSSTCNGLDISASA